MWTRSATFSLGRWFRRLLIIIDREWIRWIALALASTLLTVADLSLLARTVGFLSLVVAYVVIRKAGSWLRRTATVAAHEEEAYWPVLYKYLVDTEDVLARFVIENDPFFLHGKRAQSDTTSDIDRAQYVALAASLSPEHLNHRYITRGRLNPKRTEDLVALLTQGPEPVLVTGKPGSGKTLSLIFTFFRLKKFYLEGRSPLVPVFMYIREMEPSALDEIERMGEKSTVERMATIASHCPLGNGTEGIQRDFHRLLMGDRARSIQFAFILDGLDEIRDKHRYKELFTVIKGSIEPDITREHKFIVSCRVDEIRGYRSTLGANIAEIEPLSLRRVDDFLSRKLKSRKLYGADRTRLEQMLSGLTSQVSKQRMGVYLGNPYFLYLFVSYYAEQANAPGKGIALALNIRPLYRAELERELKRHQLVLYEELKKVVDLVLVIGCAVAATRVGLKRVGQSELRLADAKLIERCYDGLLVLHPRLQEHAAAALDRSEQEAYGALRDLLGSTIQDTVFRTLQGDRSADNLALLLPNLLRLAEGGPSSADEIGIVARWVLDKPEESAGRLLSVAVYGAVIQLLGESGIIEPAGNAIGQFKNQRLQDYFAASFIAAVGLPKFAEKFTETGAINFWWDQALSIYFAIAQDPGADLLWLLRRKDEDDVEHLVRCARCSAYIPESSPNL